MVRIRIKIDMKKAPLFMAIILVLAVPASLASKGSLALQQNEPSPTVSQVRSETRNNLIRLTWVDSPDAQGPVFVFRSTRPFGRTIPAHIRPVVIRYGDQSYIDDAEDLENLYYFIAASNTAGQRFDVIVPQVNSIHVNIFGSPAVQAPSVETAPEPEVILGISNLRARQDGERVVITFDTTEPRKNAVLFRSMQPIRHQQDLLNAAFVSLASAAPFVDFPVPGLSWYYALVYEDEISGGNIRIKPGVNATISAVTISGDEVAERPLRPMPLPLMTLSNAMPEGFFLSNVTEQTPLSDEAQRMLSTAGFPPKPLLELKNPRIFTIDLQAPSAGEDSALFQIINDFFIMRDWEGTRVNLIHYLSLPRSKEVEDRARFYLGQVLYFSGDFNGALFEFLTIRTSHPVEANAWISAVLSAMVH